MIGIFDSGSGGLTVLKAIRDELPSCDVVYFGDIARAPYGLRSHEELSRFTIQAIQFLKEQGAHKIVSACNSVSASLALSLFDTFAIDPAHIIEMVGPTVAYFRGYSGRILLCATPATIQSGIYQNAFRMIGKDIIAFAVPDLAGGLELGESEEQLRSYIAAAFRDVRWEGGDVLILGCTHYPLALPLFSALLPSSISLFDPAQAVAERVVKQFWPQEVGSSATRFFISKDSAPFKNFLAHLFPGGEYSLAVIQPFS